MILGGTSSPPPQRALLVPKWSPITNTNANRLNKKQTARWQRHAQEIIVIDLVWDPLNSNGVPWWRKGLSQVVMDSDCYKCCQRRRRRPSGRPRIVRVVFSFSELCIVKLVIFGSPQIQLILMSKIIHHLKTSWNGQGCFTFLFCIFTHKNSQIQLFAAIVSQHILGHENNHRFLFSKAVRFQVLETDIRKSFLAIVLSFVKSSSPPASILKDLKTTFITTSYHRYRTVLLFYFPFSHKKYQILCFAAIVFQHILGHENNRCFLLYKAVRFQVLETDLRKSILTIVLSFAKSSSPLISIFKDLKTTFITTSHPRYRTALLFYVPFAHTKINNSGCSLPLFSNTFWVTRTTIVSYFARLCVSRSWKPISANSS